jgi:hypothetical protein
MKFLKSVSYTGFAPVDLKKAYLYLRDGYDNGSNVPTTTDIEPVAENDIALTAMATAVPDPAISTGVSVKFGAVDDTEYTVTGRTLGSGTDEIQTIEIDDDCSGGTFTLTYAGQTTGALAHNASAAVVEAALEALSTLGLGTATVTGASPIWTVTFTGTKSQTSMALIVGDGALLTGGVVTDIQIAETVAGVDAVAEQQDFLVSGTWTSGTFTLITPAAMGGETTGPIDFDASIAEIEMALEALDGIAVGEATVAEIVAMGADAGNFHVTFSGALAGPQDQITTNVDNIVGAGATLTASTDVEGVAAVVEVQTVGINDSTTGGTFTLAWGGLGDTVPLPHNASAAAVEAALETLGGGIAAITVTGGPGPMTDWVITWVTAGVQTPITGSGTNLTGGSATAMSIVEVTAGASGTSTARITISPVLAVATTAGGSVTFGGRLLEVKVGEGNLTYDESKTREYVLDRGNLDTVRDGDDVPADVAFDLVWDFLSAVGGSAAPTIEEVLKQTGEAATWLTTSADPCEPYCVDLEVHYDPGCGGENTELIVLPYFRYEKLTHNLRDSQVSCTGKCNAEVATLTRGA